MFTVHDNIRTVSFCCLGTKGHTAIQPCQKCEICGRSCHEWTQFYKELASQLKEGSLSSREALPVVPKTFRNYEDGSNAKYYADFQHHTPRVSENVEDYPNHAEYIGWVDGLKIDWVSST